MPVAGKILELLQKPTFVREESNKNIGELFAMKNVCRRVKGLLCSVDGKSVRLFNAF